MLKEIIVSNKAYSISWTPYDVCKLFEYRSIRAEQLIQKNKSSTHQLIRDLYLLACQAALIAPTKKSKEAEVLRSYARAIKQISEEYEKIFRRTVILNEINVTEEDNTSNNSIDRLQARLFYLITQYSVHPCKQIANNIVQQLTRLCNHPHIELLPAQHYIYSQSINYWRSRLLECQKQSVQYSLH